MEKMDRDMVGSNIADGFKGFADACVSVIKQISNVIAQHQQLEIEQRKLDIKQQQQLGGFSPIAITLTHEQLMTIYNSLCCYPNGEITDVLLNRMQVTNIVSVFIEQMYAQGNADFMAYIKRMVCTGGLEYFLDPIRTLHKIFYDEFFCKCDKELSYLQVTPPDALFYFDDKYHLMYNIDIKKKVTLNRWIMSFKRFKCMQVMQDIAKQYRLNDAYISWTGSYLTITLV